MKQFIQGTLLLSMLLSTGPLFAGKCENHGGEYKNLKDCLNGEKERYDNEVDSIREDRDLVNRGIAYESALSRYQKGQAECIENCD